MGWYSAVGRRAFFALPPEASHRLAGALLGLPLPWERIGGSSPDDPRVSVSLAGIPLRNPIGLAAGFDKRCAHLDTLGRIGFGYVVGGTVTRAPRKGHPKPRIVRDPAAGSMVNAMGMPNPGVDAVAARLRKHRATAPRFVSLADEDLDDVLACARLLEPLVDGFELNASSPNAAWAHEEAHIADLVRALCAATVRPVFLKLPRFEAETDRERVVRMATSAKAAGVAGLTCANTRPVEEPRLARGRGGLSGRPLGAGTPDMLREVRHEVGRDLPLNASGGVFSAADALACIEAGATTVQVYSALIYEGPAVVGSLVRNLSDALRERETDLPTLVGSA